MDAQHEPALAPSNVTFDFEDQIIQALEGETVATALLASGIIVTGVREVSGRTRGPFCLIGVCHECLVEIDGVSSQRACLTTVRQNINVRRQTELRLFKFGKQTHEL